MNARFLQIHFLTSYPAALLNRDDVGFAKRMPFGGATRTRISSQCLKRHWRTFDGEHSLGGIDGATLSIRSRQSFQRLVYEPLVAEGVAPALAASVTRLIMAELLGKSAKAKKTEAKDAESSGPSAGGGTPSLETNQVTVLGRPELDYLLNTARAVCADAAAAAKADTVVKARLKDMRANLQVIGRGAGVDAALFGRMVTSDILARCDAALHVAHAFTVHAEATESDYFSAVDDLLQTGDEQELGSGHIGTTELTSGLFYGYVVADLRKLAENLGNDLDFSREVVRRLLPLVSTVSPGAKLGSTAPHAYAHCVIAEVGRAQPRTLANAFLSPVRERPDLLANTYRALGAYLSDLDAAYGHTTRRFLALGPAAELAPALPAEQRLGTLTNLADWCCEQIGTTS